MSTSQIPVVFSRSGLSHPPGSDPQHIQDYSDINTWLQGISSTQTDEFFPSLEFELLSHITIEPSSPSVSKVSGNTQRSLKIDNLQIRKAIHANNLFIDNFGKKIPADVQAVIEAAGILRPCSTPLTTEEQASIGATLSREWDTKEASLLSTLLSTPLFKLIPIEDTMLQQGQDTLWTTAPLPHILGATPPPPLITPKTDYHLGFATTIMCRQDAATVWTNDEIIILDNECMHDYFCPTNANIFPFLLIEGKSEVCNSSLYKAESQLVVGGAHRANSMKFLFTHASPETTISSAESLVFSLAVSQREAIAYVNFMDPSSNRFYMSYLANFYLPEVSDRQRCHDFITNVVSWGKTQFLSQVKQGLAAISQNSSHLHTVVATVSTESPRKKQRIL
ncbi:hypothetical protein N7495_007204 [Penicillium taxi]|uniref:uncharacterized protein n=1 Tax=Penicillium taxi TaxID=168475 RepID=UPI002545327A|nr:uncharacterized protein N7495_007204 [Penicillium taxi]KAJ5895513.1 hypothetical protein N7495_007204 [Penicillium taxi]